MRTFRVGRPAAAAAKWQSDRAGLITQEEVNVR